MPPRIYLEAPLSAGAELTLPPGASRHVQVLRLQPQDELLLFNGQGGEWSARVLRMGRSEVSIQVGDGPDAFDPTVRELPISVCLAVGMPANERMDALVEKATELGVSEIQPLICQRSVLRLSGERADKRVAHWQSVAVAAAEQSGRTRVPRIHPIQSLEAWLTGWANQQNFQANATEAGSALMVRASVLSLNPQALALPAALAASQPAASGTSAIAHGLAANWTFLSGPEGGLSEEEESKAVACGMLRTSLGPRILRADTAPLAALAALAVLAANSA